MARGLPEWKYAEEIHRALEEILEGKHDAARQRVHPTYWQTSEKEGAPKRQLQEWQKVRVYSDDKWHCRYCDAKVIWSPARRAVLLELGFGWHAHSKTGEGDLGYYRDIPHLEHVVPISRNGDDSRGNLVTSCGLCNQAKGRFTAAEMGWEIRPLVDDKWDGGTAAFTRWAESRSQLEPWMSSALAALRRAQRTQ